LGAFGGPCARRFSIKSFSKRFGSESGWGRLFF